MGLRLLVVGIAGIPGAGKSTVAAHIVRRVNERLLAQQSSNSSCIGTSTISACTLTPGTPNAPQLDTVVDVAVVVPMDGFHLSRAQLDTMPDPVYAHARRGAEFTFDGAAFAELVHQLRVSLQGGAPALEPTATALMSSEEEKRQAASTTNATGNDPSAPAIDSAMTVVYAPAFEHKVKDPVAGAIAVGPRQRLVVLEGNYLALAREPWLSAARLLDELWIVRVSRTVARRRLVYRHVAAGLAADECEAAARVDANDMLNADDIEAALERVPGDDFGSGSADDSGRWRVKCGGRLVDEWIDSCDIYRTITGSVAIVQTHSVAKHGLPELV